MNTSKSQIDSEIERAQMALDFFTCFPDEVSDEDLLELKLVMKELSLVKSRLRNAGTGAADEVKVSCFRADMVLSEVSETIREHGLPHMAALIGGRADAGGWIKSVSEGQHDPLK